MDFGKAMQLGLLICFVAGIACMPAARHPPRQLSRLRRMFLNIDCERPVMCAKKVAPICCTDGNTYNNTCQLQMENQRRICHEGKFNPIAKIHEGECPPTTTLTP